MGGKISREKIARPMPINRLCIGCGAVWQSWCYWWCGGARVVVLGGGASQLLGCAPGAATRCKLAAFRPSNGIENCGSESVESIEYGSVWGSLFLAQTL